MGVSTPNLPLADTVTELIGNREIAPGVIETVRVARSSITGGGSPSDIAAVADDLEAAVARIAAIEVDTTALPGALAAKADKTQTLAATGLATSSGSLGTSPTIDVPAATLQEIRDGAANKAIRAVEANQYVAEELETFRSTLPIVGAVDEFALVDGAGLVDVDDTIVGYLKGRTSHGAFNSPMLFTGLAEILIAKLRVLDIDLRRDLRLGPATVSWIEGNYDICIKGAGNSVLWGIKDQVVYQPGAAAGTDNALVGDDLLNKQASALLQATSIIGLASATADYNSIVGYGQSLMAAQQAYGPISKAADEFGNLMLGGDTRPDPSVASSFQQLAPTGFQPLVGHAYSGTYGGILDDAEVAALTQADTGVHGEVPVIGMAHLASWLIRRKTIGRSNPFVVMVPAVGGKTIEQLSKINGQDSPTIHYYNRVTSCVQQAHDAALALGKTHNVAAIVWMQGEYDEDTSAGSMNATKALYKAALAQLRDDIVADVKAITGQADDPIFILYQTGATWTRNTDKDGLPGLHIQMAQLEYALENPDRVVMAGPVYPVPDKAGHLNANGSRWFGQYLGRAFYRAAIEARRWRPLSPTRIERVDTRTIRVHFHVPTPPLRFLDYYAVNTATQASSRGFRVTDASNTLIPIASVAIVADTIVELKVVADVGDGSHVWFADAVNGGAGNLADSETLTSFDPFTWLSSNGMDPTESIAALLDQPYPANNYCVGFYLPSDYSEA